VQYPLVIGNEQDVSCESCRCGGTEARLCCRRQQMEINTESKAPIRERATDELREVAIIAGYLFVCFAAIFYLKAAILEAQNVTYAPLGLAVIKVAICAKFMLVGRAFHIGVGRGVRGRDFPSDGRHKCDLAANSNSPFRLSFSLRYHRRENSCSVVLRAAWQDRSTLNGCTTLVYCHPCRPQTRSEIPSPSISNTG
jgi:hypothetical protein